MTPIKLKALGFKSQEVVDYKLYTSHTKPFGDGGMLPRNPSPDQQGFSKYRQLSHKSSNTVMWSLKIMVEKSPFTMRVIPLMTAPDVTDPVILSEGAPIFHDAQVVSDSTLSTSCCRILWHSVDCFINFAHLPCHKDSADCRCKKAGAHNCLLWLHGEGSRRMARSFDQLWPTLPPTRKVLAAIRETRS